jgi:hypothetical protein
VVQKIGLGLLKLPVNHWQYFTVYGGPYLDIPEGFQGVKLAKEIKTPCHVSIPIKDFSIPATSALDAGLYKAVGLLLQGEPVYAGCMGGRGRTGLFLAILAKAFGVASPVEYVREHYSNHAVETTEQYDFVMNYEVPAGVARQIQQVRRWSWLRFWRTNLSQTVSVPEASLDKVAV